MSSVGRDDDAGPYGRPCIQPLAELAVAQADTAVAAVLESVPSEFFAVMDVLSTVELQDVVHPDVVGGALLGLDFVVHPKRSIVGDVARAIACETADAVLP